MTSLPLEQQDDASSSGSNLIFIKNISEKRVTRDGNAPKRRGPKPDSRPALTRRQELNRQAQRTHRERKELYIRALEDEVLRLREVYSNICHDKERLAVENRQLKQMLTQDGGTPMSASGSRQQGNGSLIDNTASNPSIGYAVSASDVFLSAPSSNTSAFMSPPFTASSVQDLSSPQGSTGQRGHSKSQSDSLCKNTGVDYEQAGIDFVLTLENPCMNHLPWLLERSAQAGGEACGHALMASCPPGPFSDLTQDTPFGSRNIKDDDIGSGQRTWELSKGDLSTLMFLSSRLNLGGEITPVMAWAMIMVHPRLGEMTPAVFQNLTNELRSKVRCYGFGAVMEEFEVRDAIKNVLSTKPFLVSPESYPISAMV